MLQARAFTPTAGAQTRSAPGLRALLGRTRHGVHARSTSGQNAPAAPRASTFHHGITYTSYECNTFAVKFNSTGVRVLVDPWLVDDLVFFEQDWLFRGKKRMLRNQEVDVKQVAAETDLVVLTQGLDDHCHMPTMSLLPRTMPLLVAPSAAEKVQSLGFKNVTVLDHGQSTTLCEGRLRVKASVGALTGPPWSKRQIGFVLQSTDAESPVSLYYEPHCDFDERSVSQLGSVDVVVSPVQSQLLNMGVMAYPVVMGDINLEKLLRLLRPRVLVPLLNAEIDQEGQLASLVTGRGPGSRDAVAAMIMKAGLSTRVEMPAPGGEALAIAL